MECMLMRYCYCHAAPQEKRIVWPTIRSDFVSYSKIQSSEEHLMERVTKVGNADGINSIIGYNNTDTGFTTVCVAPNHLLTFVNVSFLFFVFPLI